MTTCIHCGKHWGGLNAQHCPVCHETFTGSTAGDMHRRGPFDGGRYCLEPAEAGLEWNTKRGMWKTPGTWQPDMEETK